jgi:hypothetical protein
MTGQLYYPRADRVTQRFDDNYAGIKWSGSAEKGCLHTTETPNWPDYDGGKKAPTFTARPNFTYKRIDWRQHFPANMSVRALQNKPGGVETNRDKVIQVEIVGTCDGKPGGAHRRWLSKGVPHLYTPEAPDWFLDQMADFFVWCLQEHGIFLRAPGLWLPYDASYGNSSVRMSGSEFNAFRGWLGHMHVAENDHGDPGALDVSSIIIKAKNKISGPTKPQEEEDDDMKATDKVRLGPANSMILKQPDGVMTYEETVAAQTGAAVLTNQLLQEVLENQKAIDDKLGQLLSKPE